MKLAILKMYSNELEIKCIDDNHCLEELNKLVGGYIEVIPFRAITSIEYPKELDDVLIILDEEGKLKGKPINVITEHDFLVGDIVFAGMDEDISGLSDSQIKLLELEVKKFKRVH